MICDNPFDWANVTEKAVWLDPCEENYYYLKATPHDHRLSPLYVIHLQIFRHITQIYLEIR